MFNVVSFCHRCIRWRVHTINEVMPTHLLSQFSLGFFNFILPLSLSLLVRLLFWSLSAQVEMSFAKVLLDLCHIGTCSQNRKRAFEVCFVARVFRELLGQPKLKICTPVL